MGEPELHVRKQAFALIWGQDATFFAEQGVPRVAGGAREDVRVAAHTGPAGTDSRLQRHDDPSPMGLVADGRGILAADIVHALHAVLLTQEVARIHTVDGAFLALVLGVLFQRERHPPGGLSFQDGSHHPNT